MVRSLTWALGCDRPQRRRSVLLQVLEVDLGGGRRLKRCTRRSKFDEASSNVLVNRQDQRPRPESVLLPLPLGCLHFLVGSFAWCPRPEEISTSLQLRCLNTKGGGSFLNEPRPFLLAFLYIARKRKMRQSILELLFYLGDLVKKPPRGKKSVPFKLYST